MAVEKIRVRMLRSVSGTDVTYDAGQEYDLPALLAKAFITEPQDDPRAAAVAQKPAKRAERRPAAKRAEKRG